MCGIDSTRAANTSGRTGFGIYPEGIKSFSPGLRSTSYPGTRTENIINPKGLNGLPTTAGAGDATPLGLGIILGDDYPG